MDKKALTDEANALQGCLADRRTMTGRRKNPVPEDETLVLPRPFQPDEAKLLSSKAFRLLRKKTQVTTKPDNPYIRTRDTHVLEVVAVSVIASEMLGLNTSLVRAIAIGHDIGHVPLGHQGEKFMAEAMGCSHFCHEVMAPLIAQRVERKGVGLNLTFEVLEGMMCHSGEKAYDGMTQEAWVVRYTDKLAYIFADYNDLVVRMGYPACRELREIMDEFGHNQRRRTTTALAGLIIESAEHGRVSFQHSEAAKKFARLRELMYEIYGRVTLQNTENIMRPVLDFLTELKICNPFLMLALMTDDDVLRLAQTPMLNLGHLKDTALSEVLPHLETISPIGEPLDLCNPYLNW